ncbi:MULTISPECIES: hypothetical protein [Nocardia]|uniref:hypothetical protein n=1 Tax=Nocardia TaxID=1817 RepID=UPI000D68AB28|nr:MULTISPECIES: hypothetical protein [Nocardia]
MTDPCAGSTDVLVPTGMHPNDLYAYIRHRVASELAESGDWPREIEFRLDPAEPRSPGVTRWRVTYKSRVFCEEI